MRGRFTVVFAGIGLIALPGGAEAAGPCPAPLGALVAIEGQVEFREHPGATWRPASTNAPLCPGAMVRVGARSRATATLPDAPTYRIDQNTTFHLVSAPAKPERPAVIRLVQGALYIFSRRPRTLEIDTPLVDAAVEGTEFLVRAERTRTVITVFEGTVVARNDHGETRAAAGHAAIAEAGRAPVSRLIVRPRTAVEWALHYPPILTVLADPRAATAPDMPQPVRDAARRASRGDVRGALDKLDAVPAAERDASFHLHRAAILLSVGRVDEARADIDRALAQDPDAGLAYALRAVIAVARNDNERALLDGRRAVELSPGSAAALIALSYAQQARFDLDGARDSLLTAVKAQPKDALAWARLSELWLMAGRRDRARDAAETAADLAPDLARVQSVLGFAALAEFRTRAARRAFEHALARDPSDPLPRFGLGLARIRQGDLETGRNDIEIAVGLDPDRSLLRSYLGKAYFEERRADLAGEQFAIAKDLDPNDPTPFLYDAIRKQSENRPVEALRDLEESIALNDNRAVYRSRELLDQDRAGRGTSLARIYNDLGFEQLGINEATRSLSLDPSSAAAHRFLSDVYATQPRREIARVSELLQAQLLQDININPVQPSLSETNLNIITGGGPFRPGFNEFTPLFERNRAQLNLSGEVGNSNTLADEAVVSGLYDRFSLSAGQFHYTTDGFRKNFDIQHDIQNLFAQAAVTPELNVQGEFRRRRTEEGDIRLNFHPGRSDQSRRRDFDTEQFRAGLRFSPGPRSDFLTSLIYNDWHQKIQYARDDGINEDDRLNQDGIQGEALYLFRGNRVNLSAGLGVYDVDAALTIGFPPPIDVSTRSNFRIEHKTAYVYSNIHGPDGVIWTLGLNYDDFEQADIKLKKISPKAGVQWDITEGLRLRLAAFRTLKPALVANRTIQPTEISGFNQFFDDANGTEAWCYGIGLDAGIMDNLKSGVELSRRNVEGLVNTLNDDDASLGKTVREDRIENLLRAYLYWVPDPEWAATGEVRFDGYHSEKGLVINRPRHVETLSLPVSVHYFNPFGFFGGFGGTFVHQNVARRTGSSLPEGSDNFVVVDAAAGYRFPRRRGLIGLDIRNLLDSDLKFQDDSYREFRDGSTVSPYFPERTVLARVFLNF